MANTISQFLKDVGKSSFTKQIATGAASGWVTGLVTIKVGKAAACALGASIILLQIAQHKGYIFIDWEKFREQAEQTTSELEQRYDSEGLKIVTQVKQFALQNRVFSAGFAGGFLIGIAS